MSALPGLVLKGGYSMYKVIALTCLLAFPNLYLNKPKSAKPKEPLIEIIDETIGDKTYEKFVNYFVKYRLGNFENNQLNVVIKSTGGYLISVIKIQELMRTIKSLGVFINCHLIQGMSAAASLFQECSKRIVYLNSVYGQHRAGLGGTGTCSMFCIYLDLIRLKTEAKRLNISVEKYRESLPPLTDILFWYGRNIKKAGLADVFHDTILTKEDT